jgi:hypothetical protein
MSGVYYFEGDGNMRVVVSGKVMDVLQQVDKKTGEIKYTAMVYQSGERELARVRCNGSVVPEIGDDIEIEGRLMIWAYNGNADCMVIPDDR